MIPETLWVLEIKLLFERIYRNVKLSVGRFISKGFLDHNKDSNFLYAPTETKLCTNEQEMCWIISQFIFWML